MLHQLCKLSLLISLYPSLNGHNFICDGEFDVHRFANLNESETWWKY